MTANRSLVLVAPVSVVALALAGAAFGASGGHGGGPPPAPPPPPNHAQIDKCLREHPAVFGSAAGGGFVQCIQMIPDVYLTASNGVPAEIRATFTDEGHVVARSVLQYGQSESHRFSPGRHLHLMIERSQGSAWTVDRNCDFDWGAGTDGRTLLLQEIDVQSTYGQYQNTGVMMCNSQIGGSTRVAH